MDKIMQMSAFEELDRRQKRTREAIDAAFIELLFAHNYNAITVAMVAQRANIGRSTLYEHYRTKADMLRAAVRFPMNAVATVIGSREIPSQLAWWLDHFREKQALGRVLLYGPTREIMSEVLAQIIENKLLPIFDTPPIIPIKLLSKQIAAAQMELLTPWVLGQIAISQEKMAMALHQTSNAMVNAILKP